MFAKKEEGKKEEKKEKQPARQSHTQSTVVHKRLCSAAACLLYSRRDNERVSTSFPPFLFLPFSFTFFILYLFLWLLLLPIWQANQLVLVNVCVWAEGNSSINGGKKDEESRPL